MSGSSIEFERRDRYREPWRDRFDALTKTYLTNNVRVLDVGSGRTPAIAPETRPSDCRYSGLDLSRRELELAPAGSYDETWVSDVTRFIPELQGRFDLIVSWQVFEHVKPLDVALENLRAYLRPGGGLVALFSGSFSAFGLINQVIPSRLGVWAMHRLLSRPPESVFPAYYHHCWDGRLQKILSAWSYHEVIPLYRAAGYFGFSRPLQRLYLTYEDWAMAEGHRNLASHYLVQARK